MPLTAESVGVGDNKVNSITRARATPAGIGPAAEGWQAEPPSWTARPAPAPRRPGHPSEYSPRLATRILHEIMGGASVRKVCAQPWAPSAQTFYRWLGQYPDFLSGYTWATELRIHALYDEILAIADDSSRDWITKKDGMGRLIRIPNTGAVERDRLRIHARQWIIERMRPRKYGHQARNPSLPARILEARQRAKAHPEIPVDTHSGQFSDAIKRPQSQLEGAAC